jgi:hypothetical protein
MRVKLSIIRGQTGSFYQKLEILPKTIPPKGRGFYHLFWVKIKPPIDRGFTAATTSVKTIPSFVDVGVNGIDPFWDYNGIDPFWDYNGIDPFWDYNGIDPFWDYRGV